MTGHSNGTVSLFRLNDSSSLNTLHGMSDVTRVCVTLLLQQIVKNWMRQTVASSVSNRLIPIHCSALLSKLSKFSDRLVNFVI